MIKVEEITKHNVIVDYSGIGIKLFDFSSESLQRVIEDDLMSNYNCINYLKSMVEIEEGIYTATNSKDNTRLKIRLYMKTENCTEDEMIDIITSYLKNTFIKN